MDWRKSATAASNSILDVAQNSGKDVPTGLGVFPVRLVLIDSGRRTTEFSADIDLLVGILELLPRIT